MVRRNRKQLDPYLEYGELDANQSTISRDRDP